jgi:hypothetical protein
MPIIYDTSVLLKYPNKEWKEEGKQKPSTLYLMMAEE